MNVGGRLIKKEQVLTGVKYELEKKWSIILSKYLINLYELAKK